MEEIKSNKKSALKIPQKISGREALRRYRKVLGENEEMRKREENNFRILFSLAVNLYNIMPSNQIFTSGALSDEFMEMVKKSVEDFRKKAKEDSGELKDGSVGPVESVIENNPENNAEAVSP